MRRLAQAWIWLALAAISILILSHAFAGDWGGALSSVAIGGVLLVLLLRKVPLRRLTQSAVVVGLFVVVADGASSWWLIARSWNTLDTTVSRIGVSPLGPIERIKGGGQGGALNRSVDVRGAAEITVRLATRLTSGTAGTYWLLASPGMRQAARTEDGRAVSVISAGDVRDPWAARYWRVGRSIGLRTFRVTLEARAVGPAPADREGLLYLTGDGVRHSKSRGISVSEEWRRFSLEWAVPRGVRDTVLKVVINGLHGALFAVRGLTLEELTGGTWTRRSFPEPSPARLLVQWVQRGDPRTVIDAPLQPSEDWTLDTFTFEVPSPVEEAGRVVAVMRVLPEVVLDTRDYDVVAHGAGPSAVPVRPGPRATFSLADTTLVAPLAVLLALVMLTIALPTTTALGLFVAVVSAVVVALSGTRAALAGLVTGGLLLTVVRRRSLPGAVILLTIVGGVLVAATVVPETVSRLFALDTPGAPSRLEIWSAAWRATISHPWTGLRGSSFESFFASSCIQWCGTKVHHAHNLWLQAGVTMGYPGLVAAILGTGALLLAGVRVAGYKGLVLCVPVLVMNVFDLSLTFWPTWVLLGLALPALSPKE